MKTSNVIAFDVSVLDEYDILIAACGYEQRCTHVSKKISNVVEKKVCLKFCQRLNDNSSDNLRWFKENGFDIHELNDELDQLISSLFEALNSDAAIRVAIDYSSMNRKILAKLIFELVYFVEQGKLELHFLYSPATYSPPDDVEQFITVSEPVLPEFSGKLSSPSLPTVALAGIGFENERTLGVLEYLEPALVKVFLPIGVDSEFDQVVSELNRDLFEFISPNDVIKYELRKPYELFQTLESICFGMLAWSRPVMVPLGPKPFTLVSLLVSRIFDCEPVVWRVSDEQNAPASDRFPTGDVIALGIKKRV